MKIAISTDTAADLTKDLITQFNVHAIPLTITLGNRVVLDGEIPHTDIFAYFAKTKQLAKTSAINDFQYEEHFKKLLKSYDAIIHISLSSGLSASYAAAKRASEQMKNVYLIDSKNLSTGIALPVIYASKLAKAGVAPQEICALVEARIPHTQASFVIEKLDYLYKGGRCSALQLLGANLFKLRPQILVSPIDGKMSVGKKFRGTMPHVIKEYCADTLEKFNTPDLDTGFITYTTATEEMLTQARAAMKAAGFKNIYETTAGSTISCHCGENTLGILYFNDGNQKQL